jgi:hypothetical protein
MKGIINNMKKVLNILGIVSELSDEALDFESRLLKVRP